MINDKQSGKGFVKKTPGMQTCKSGEETTEINPKYVVTDTTGYYRRIFWNVIFNENMKRKNG